MVFKQHKEFLDTLAVTAGKKAEKRKASTEEEGTKAQQKAQV